MHNMRASLKFLVWPGRYLKICHRSNEIILKLLLRVAYRVIKKSAQFLIFAKLVFYILFLNFCPNISFFKLCGL